MKSEKKERVGSTGLGEGIQQQPRVGSRRPVENLQLLQQTCRQALIGLLGKLEWEERASKG